MQTAIKRNRRRAGNPANGAVPPSRELLLNNSRAAVLAVMSIAKPLPLPAMRRLLMRTI
jgi:hypothetical protein